MFHNKNITRCGISITQSVRATVGQVAACKLSYQLFDYL